jgi:hypothetical protein
MKVYDSNRILTTRELRKDDILHGGMLAGHCVKWTVLEVHFQYAFVKIGDSIVRMRGSDLRQFEFYLKDKCPNCKLQREIAVIEKNRTIQNVLALSAPDVKSSWQFKAAQYTRRRKIG